MTWWRRRERAVGRIAQEQCRECGGGRCGEQDQERQQRWSYGGTQDVPRITATAGLPETLDRHLSSTTWSQRTTEGRAKQPRSSESGGSPSGSALRGTHECVQAYGSSFEMFPYDEKGVNGYVHTSRAILLLNR